MPNQNPKFTSHSEPVAADGSDMTRRTAIGKIASGSAAGALAVSCVSLGSEASAAMVPMLRITADDWQQYVETSFRVGRPAFEEIPGPRGATLKLEQVIAEDWVRLKDTHRPANLRPTPISLLFSSDKAIANASYELEHARLGKATLFLHEIRRADHVGKKIYEAILN